MSAANKQVVVIGAGIAGLVTAKVLLEDGFDVTVLEREPAIGGVWTPSRTYPGLRTNNSRDTYAFSDHPYPPGTDVFPTAPQVRDYLDSYVTRFELDPLIQLATEVLDVSRLESGFVVRATGPSGPLEYRCDFVVVCTGTYSEPRMPEFDGDTGTFTGSVLHSSQALDETVFAGKRVVVVGAGKSALDCAVWAAEHAASATLVFRRPIWMIPRWWPGGIPADRVVLGRSSELMLPYHHGNPAERFLHGPGRLLPRLFWRVAARGFRRQLGLPAPLAPDGPLPLGLQDGGGFVDAVGGLVRSGRIRLRRDTIDAFGERDVRLRGGERIAADVVVFATGWRQTLPFLAPELTRAVLQDNAFHLFRHILPPTEQRLGFVGFASSTACQLTSEMSAHWLSQAFRGELELPAPREMDAEIERVRAWLAEVFPARAQGYYIGPHLTHHIGDLLDDMGVPTRRTRSLLGEYFGQFTPARYARVGAQRRALRQARSR